MIREWCSQTSKCGWRVPGVRLRSKRLDENGAPAYYPLWVLCMVIGSWSPIGQVFIRRKEGRRISGDSIWYRTDSTLHRTNSFEQEAIRKDDHNPGASCRLCVPTCS